MTTDYERLRHKMADIEQQFAKDYGPQAVAYIQACATFAVADAINALRTSTPQPPKCTWGLSPNELCVLEANHDGFHQGPTGGQFSLAAARNYRR